MDRGTGALSESLTRQADRLSNCVHCGFCLPVCPTYVRLHDEADSPRGRLHLMRAVVEGRLDAGSEAFQRHLDRCLGCRACETVCPSGVEYGFLLERAREAAGEARPLGGYARILLESIRRPALFRAWMVASRVLRWSRVPSLLARLLPSRGPLRTLRLGMAMLAASLPWQVPGSRPAARAGAPGEEGYEAGPTDLRGRVAVLDGCVQGQLFRRVNRATTRVLQANGWEVVSVAGQGCCGALHAHSGRLGDAREMARRNIAAFRAIGVEWIVANAAGCGATMREYGHLLDGEGDREDAEWFAERVRDVSELLAAAGRRPRSGAPLRIRAAYDPPCHLLHGQGIDAPPRALLRSIPGLTLLPVPRGEECCGGAGIYGLTHPDLGDRIGGDKVEAVAGTEADVLATGNPGCAMQIGAGLRMQGWKMGVVHPVELLDESYRRAGFYDGGGPSRAAPRPRGGVPPGPETPRRS